MPVVATKAITTFHLNRLGSRIKYKISNEAKEMIDELSYEFVNSVVVQASLNSDDAAQITEKDIGSNGSRASSSCCGELVSAEI